MILCVVRPCRSSSPAPTAQRCAPYNRIPWQPLLCPSIWLAWPTTSFCCWHPTQRSTYVSIHSSLAQDAWVSPRGQFLDSLLRGRTSRIQVGNWHCLGSTPFWLWRRQNSLDTDGCSAAYLVSLFGFTLSLIFFLFTLCGGGQRRKHLVYASRQGNTIEQRRIFCTTPSNTYNNKTS